MLSLNQLKQLFNDKQLNHAQLSSGTFLFDEEAEFGAAREITYPLEGVTFLGGVLDGNILRMEFDFVFVDLVHQDNSSKDDTMSSMLQVALDISSQLRYDLQYYFDATVTTTLNLEPLVGVYDDDVTGIGFKLFVEQFYDRSTCLTPSSGNHAGQVRILDQYGNVLQYLNPGTDYTVEVLQEIIDTITGNSATIIDPIT